MDGLAAYSWAILYFVTICFEMTYGKKITSGVRFNSMWGPTFYTNFLSMLPMFLLGYAMGDFDKFGWVGFVFPELVCLCFCLCAYTLVRVSRRA